MRLFIELPSGYVLREREFRKLAAEELRKFGAQRGAVNRSGFGRFYFVHRLALLNNRLQLYNGASSV